MLAAGTIAAAKKTAADAHGLHERSDEVHRKVESLHDSIHQTHLTAERLRKQSRERTALSSEEPVGPEPIDRRSEEAELEAQAEIRPHGKPFPIVGIGASAGGFEALRQFLSVLPKDTGMAFVVVQHLDPSHESKLAELLRHSAALSITEITHGLNVKPNQIYVMPANVTLTISGGRLRLASRKSDEMPPMPVDKFLRSLAADQQDLAIGVILSGTGTDGTLGLEAIKGEGGVTFAQDEPSSKYFGMPGSAIAAGGVDFILHPEAIAQQLGRIARHPYVKRSPAGQPRGPAEASAPWDKALRAGEGELATVFGLLRRGTGVDFSGYKHSTLKRRIVRRMILHKLESLGNYVKFLESSPAEATALFNDLLINVTEFFRDPAAFQTLQKKVFPKLIKAHRGDSPLRLWVCGCSTGEEAYSLAIALVEFFEKNRTHRPVQIFGTDISEAGIEKARAGIYPENIQQDVSAERLRRFFTKVNGHYQVHKSIRDLCVFARQNVIVDPPFSNLDLISCRNLLIYLGPDLQRKVMPTFHYALRPDGVLWLGTSETIGKSADFFLPINKKHRIYTKKLTFNRPAFEMPRLEPGDLRQAPVTAVPVTIAAEPAAGDLQQHVDRMLLRDFSPAAVVINSAMEVLQFRGRTGRYLEHASGDASLNLIKMAHENLAMDLRSAVGRAITTDEPTQQKGIQLRENGQVIELEIKVVPFRVAVSSERLFLVLFRETGAHETERAGNGKAGSGSKSSAGRRELERLRQELSSTKETLQSIIEEQEATNEELKSANEEIQSSNEELQSTNEELETAKEELQSTNEELTTLNEELQNRNTELTGLTNDLTNLLGSVNMAVLMLGNDLTIRRFTPMAERLFNLIPSDAGRRLSDMNRSILMPDLDESIKEVIDNLMTIEREVQDRQGRWYSLRIRPYRTRENRIEGAVLMLVDIDDLKRALDEVMAVVKQPILTLTPELKIKKANDFFCQSFGLKAEEVENKHIYEIANGQWNVPRLQTLLEAILPDNKKVVDFDIETEFQGLGTKQIRLNARRFYENSRQMELIFLSMELLPNSS
jgi:two-component system CheB/CheR fusion protein